MAPSAIEAIDKVMGIPKELATVPQMRLPTTKPPFNTSRYTDSTLAPIHFGADLKVGAYIVEVRQGENKKTLKLIKQ